MNEDELWVCGSKWQPEGWNDICRQGDGHNNTQERHTDEQKWLNDVQAGQETTEG